MFFWKFSENFQNSFGKEQSYFHAVDTVKESDGLLKDSIRSALSSEIHNICKLRTI